MTTAGPAGAFLGRCLDGSYVFAEGESAVLVLAPPRKGKTTCIVVPSVLCARGPVLTTSTKLDVLHASHHQRRQQGNVWVFDPSGREVLPPGVTRLRWSPITSAGVWDDALVMARAMTRAEQPAAGTTDEAFWTGRARALLAPVLHAAALARRDVGEVSDWIARQDLDTPAALLEAANATRPAAMLEGIARTSPRERASIFATTANTLAAYDSDVARSAATSPNFDADRFVRSSDTIFVCGPAHLQDLTAPLIVGLITEVRQAVYTAIRTGVSLPLVTLVLDEVANIAPLHDLPAMVSEAGGQGLHVVACLQDLSQARDRWGASVANGFLSLFGTKVVMGGIFDVDTTQALSVASNEEEQLFASTHTTDTPQGPVTREGQSRRWRPRLTSGDISGIPRGRALAIRDTVWSTVELVPYWAA